LMEGQRVHNEIKRMRQQHEQEKRRGGARFDAATPRSSDREKLEEYAEAMDEEGKTGAKKLAKKSKRQARRN